MRKCAMGWVMMGLALGATSAEAAPPPELQLYYNNFTVLRANPIGLISYGQFGYRARLYENDNPAFENNFAGLSAVYAVSPAFFRGGLMAEIQPLSVLKLWASYEFHGYFGTFDFFQSFGHVNEDFSDTALGERSGLPDDDPLQNYSTTGSQLTLGALAQFKVGPLAVRNQLRVGRANYDLREGDTVFYDIFFDWLFPDEGWFLSNDADLLYVTDFGLTIGARYTLTHAFYEDRNFLPADRGTDVDSTTQRVGPLVAYTFSSEPRAQFNRPTILMVVNWWLSHRYRTGQDVSQAVPYFLLGFTFSGDLLAP